MHRNGKRLCVMLAGGIWMNWENFFQASLFPALFGRLARLSRYHSKFNGNSKIGLNFRKGRGGGLAKKFFFHSPPKFPNYHHT